MTLETLEGQWCRVIAMIVYRGKEGEGLGRVGRGRRREKEKKRKGKKEMKVRKMGKSRADGLLAGDGGVNAYGIGQREQGRQGERRLEVVFPAATCAFLLAQSCISRKQQKTSSTPLTLVFRLPYPCAVSPFRPVLVKRVTRKERKVGEGGRLFCYLCKRTRPLSYLFHSVRPHPRF